jgi:hypothetical protein
MRVVRLGKVKWTVYATCDDDGNCALLDFLAGINEVVANEILTDLREYVPASDQAEWFKTKFAKKLDDAEKVHEFRWPKNSGPTPRVYFFFDQGHVIVCTDGELKKDRNDQTLIANAAALRTKYVAARVQRKLTVVSYDEYLED